MAARVLRRPRDARDGRTGHRTSAATEAARRSTRHGRPAGAGEERPPSAAPGRASRGVPRPAAARWTRDPRALRAGRRPPAQRDRPAVAHRSVAQRLIRAMPRPAISPRTVDPVLAWTRTVIAGSAAPAIRSWHSVRSAEPLSDSAQERPGARSASCALTAWASACSRGPRPRGPCRPRRTGPAAGRRAAGRPRSP